MKYTVSFSQKDSVQSVGSLASSLGQNSPEHQGKEMPIHGSLHRLGEFRKIQPRTNTCCGNKFSPTVFGRVLSNFNTFKRSVRQL